MERPGVRESYPSVGTALEATDRQPRGAIELHRRIDGAFVRPAARWAIGGRERLDNLAIDDDLNSRQWKRTDCEAAQAVVVRSRGRLLEALAGVVSVKRDEEHRACG